MLFKQLRQHLKAARNKRGRLSARFTEYSSLEPRQLLVAGITFDMGTVFIEGSNEGDSAAVIMIDEDTISVALSAIDSETFNVADVDLIRFRGLGGNDRFNNQTDIDSTAFGHDGNDRLIGGGGHNRFQGGDGDDILVGGGKNDSLRGRDGDDTIQGGLRHDRLFGGNGDDEIRGEHGRDRINGEGGNDQLIGGNHDDRIDGGDGEDTLIGNAGNDRLLGGDDDDSLKGGSGDDVLSGEAGNDSIKGFAGDDELNGDAGSDELEGGDGNDVLLGGIGSKDMLFGDEGFDRLLLSMDDETPDADSTDAVIQFVDSGSLIDGGIWFNEQIKTVDAAFALIAQRTNGSIDLLQDSTAGNPIQFEKNDAAVPGNASENDVRTITLANWDDTDDVQVQSTIASVIHQTAFTWDSATEINEAFPGGIDHIGLFQSESGWMMGTTVPPGFTASTDGEWFYSSDAEFLDERGMINPSGDWATIWELALDPDASPADLDRLASKLALVGEFFDSAGPNV